MKYDCRISNSLCSEANTGRKASYLSASPKCCAADCFGAKHYRKHQILISSPNATAPTPATPAPHPLTHHPHPCASICINMASDEKIAHVDHIFRVFWNQTWFSLRHYCFSLQHYMYLDDNYDSIHKRPSFNNQQPHRTSLLEHSPAVLPALSHQQPSPPQIDATYLYMSFESRLSSFTESWHHTTGLQSPWRMAMAGFFYMGKLIEHYQTNVNQAYNVSQYLKQRFDMYQILCLLFKWSEKQHNYICVITVVADGLA